MMMQVMNIGKIPVKAWLESDRVMDAQSDLVEIMYTLKQILCVKG